MTLSSTNVQEKPGSDIEPLRAKWGWIVALGATFVFVGFVALGSVVMATVASVLMVGVMMIVAGVAEVIHAFQIKTWGKFLLWAVLGVLYILAGFATFENPLFAAALLTLVLGGTLIASGIMRLVLAFSMTRERSWLWVAISGLPRPIPVTTRRDRAAGDKLFLEARQRSGHGEHGCSVDLAGS